jgi:hypothetical protein
MIGATRSGCSIFRAREPFTRKPEALLSGKPYYTRDSGVHVKFHIHQISRQCAFLVAVQFQTGPRRSSSSNFYFEFLLRLPLRGDCAILRRKFREGSP